jgi:hypothetical protein
VSKAKMAHNMIEYVFGRRKGGNQSEIGSVLKLTSVDTWATLIQNGMCAATKFHDPTHYDLKNGIQVGPWPVSKVQVSLLETTDYTIRVQVKWESWFIEAWREGWPNTSIIDRTAFLPEMTKVVQGHFGAEFDTSYIITELIASRCDDDCPCRPPKINYLEKYGRLHYCGDEDCDGECGVQYCGCCIDVCRCSYNW